MRPFLASVSRLCVSARVLSHNFSYPSSIVKLCSLLKSIETSLYKRIDISIFGNTEIVLFAEKGVQRITVLGLARTAGNI